MNFRQLVAKYVSGNLSTKQIPEIAVVAIEEGLESDSLYILAGLENNENSFEINHYLELALKELGINKPDKRRAALEYACGIADDIIAGHREIVEGLREIKSSALDSYNFWDENIIYVYDSIHFEPVYGLYVQYEDMIDEWVSGVSDANAMADLKVELMEELKKWNKKIKPLLSLPK